MTAAYNAGSGAQRLEYSPASTGQYASFRLRRIHKFLIHDACEQLMYAFITSKNDYCSALYI